MQTVCTVRDEALIFETDRTVLVELLYKTYSRLLEIESRTDDRKASAYADGKFIGMVQMYLAVTGEDRNALWDELQERWACEHPNG